MFSKSTTLSFASVFFIGGLVVSCSGPETKPPVVTKSVNTRVSTVAQFNELMEHMAMNFVSSFSFHCTGSAATMVTHSLWGDYSGTYKIASAAGGMSKVTLDYPHYVHILAAHRNPAYEEKLSDREKSTLREAQRLVRKLRPSGGDRFEHIVNIHDYIVKEYKADLEGPDCVMDLLLDEHGACWAHSRAFWLLAQMSGIPCHIVNGHAGGGEHSWNLVQMDNGEWYHMDTTWDDPITRGADAGDTIEYHRYFLLCDYHMGLDHSWNHAPFPKSGHHHAQYFVNRHLVFNSCADFWNAAKRAYYSGKFEYEGWITPFNEDEFRAEMKKTLEGDSNMTSCGWIGPKAAEGSVRVLFN